MSYQKRIPPIRLYIDENKYNNLVESITFKSKFMSEEDKNKSDKLLDKIIKYSVHRTDENNNQMVDIRFYSNEAELLLYILTINMKTQISKD